MAFSLSSWFKGKPGSSEAEGDANGAKPGKETTRTPSVPPAASAGSPPPSVRTVLPSQTQQQAAPVSLRTPGAPNLPGARPPTTRNLSVRPPARKVSFPVPSAAVAPVTTPSIPRVVAAPEPAPTLEAPDATVSLEVGDFIDRLPAGFLAPGAVDRSRVVEFRASELYSDLTKGRASVPASTIYAKCPELFARPVSDTEDAEVSLPLQKLVEQLSMAFTTRTDQVAQEEVSEIETPFLQVAMEDNERLPTATGTNAGALRPPVALPVLSAPEAAEGLPQRPAHRTGQISAISPKPSVEPAPAPTFAPPSAPPINPGKRPPSTVRASVAGGKIRLSGPSAVTRMAPGAPVAVPPPAGKPMANPSSTTQRIEVPRGPAVAPPGASSPSHQVAKKTARIQIPPISLKPATGPGAGANTPRPPAAPPAALPVQPSPVSIHPPAADKPLSFRSSPPPPPKTVKIPPPSFAPQRPSFPPPSFPATPPGAGLNVPPPMAAPPDDRRIELGLAAVLRAQPASALAVEPESVPDDARFSLPFGLVERQLSTGRVLVPRAAFLDALPEAHRNVLAADGGLTEVQIPLQEVFQNLPGNALAMRQDQVVEEVADLYPTPFKQKAEEDAQRLGGSVAPLAPSPAPAREETAPTEEAEIPEARVDAPLLPVEEEPSPTAPEGSIEPIRDVPLDLGEQTVAEEPTASKRKRRSAGKPAPTADSEPLPAEPAPVTGIHPPEESVVEPPADIEPAPVAEALAVLESTAPGEEIAPPTAAREEEEPIPSPAADPVTAVLEAKAPEPEPEPAVVPPTRGRVQAVSAQDTELQTLFMTEDELDAKGVVRHVCRLPGVTGCAVMFADGLRLAGNFPDGDTEGFSAMAPPFFKRTSHFATEADLGALRAVTLHTDRGMFSFFMHEDICLSVSHTGRGFLPGVREKLEIVTRELVRMYPSEPPAQPSADHDI